MRLSTTNLIRHATLLIEPARESVYPRTTDKILFVFETTRIYVMLLKFAIYPDWGKVGKANMRQFAGFCLMLRLN